MFDRDNSSTISFDEFVSLWKYIDDWQKCFRSFDKDKSGSIDRQELKLALTSFGKSVNMSCESLTPIFSFPNVFFSLLFFL